MKAEDVVAGFFFGLLVGIPLGLIFFSRPQTVTPYRAPSYAGAPVQAYQTELQQEAPQIGMQNEASYDVVRDEQGRLKGFIVHRKVLPITGNEVTAIDVSRT